MEITMKVYTDPQQFVSESNGKMFLSVNNSECKVLLAALKSFNTKKVDNHPETESLETAINEINNALDGDKKAYDTYQAPEGCVTCQE
tara:strand:+ start:262 stop:525 length:264 start_codon:yes stop_codon:yes gene_type:complete